jgi:hypothetical protein
VLQRYVSKELTHFVGKSLASDDERYNLLLKILKEGLLRGTGITDEDIERDNFYTNINFYSRDGSKGKFSNETLVETPSVCFCDIPVNDLGIHMGKYKRFGLSFIKEFLIEKRANPVFYVAIDSKSTIRDQAINSRGNRYDEQLKLFAWRMNSLLSSRELIINSDLKGSGLINIVDDFEKIYRFFGNEILPFLKPFECCKSESDEKNYYMEREWRVLGFVRFTLDDVCRIILPKSYIKRFRDDVPNYYGQITFADEYTLPENISTESETT